MNLLLLLVSELLQNLQQHRVSQYEKPISKCSCIMFRCDQFNQSCIKNHSTLPVSIRTCVRSSYLGKAHGTKERWSQHSGWCQSAQRSRTHRIWKEGRRRWWVRSRRARHRTSRTKPGGQEQILDFSGSSLIFSPQTQNPESHTWTES